MAYPLKLPARPWYWWAALPIALTLLIVMAMLAAIARSVMHAATWVGERLIDWLL